VFVIVALGTFAAWGAKVSAQYMLCFPDSYTIDISESGSPVNYLNGATSANQLAVYNITWSDSQTSSLSIVAHGELGPETYDMCQAAAPVYGGDCTPDQGRAPILCSPMFYDADLISGNGGEPAEFDASFQHNYVKGGAKPGQCGGVKVGQ
jgi:hypothetical protein